MKCLYEDLPKQIDEEFAPSKKSTEKLTDVYLRIGEMKRAGRVNELIICRKMKIRHFYLLLLL